MQNPIYLLSWVAGFCAIWLLWGLAIKKLFLDVYRERLFELRFDLFRLGMTGELDFNGEVYRELETLMCGMLRFAHRISIATYVLGRIAQARAKRSKDYVDVANLLALKISRLTPETREKIVTILKEMSAATCVYMGVTSLFFMVIFIVMEVAKLFGYGPLTKRSEEIPLVIQREAYQSELMHSNVAAFAA